MKPARICSADEIIENPLPYWRGVAMAEQGAVRRQCASQSSLRRLRELDGGAPGGAQPASPSGRASPRRAAGCSNPPKGGIAPPPWRPPGAPFPFGEGKREVPFGEGKREAGVSRAVKNRDDQARPRFIARNSTPNSRVQIETQRHEEERHAARRARARRAGTSRRSMRSAAVGLEEKAAFAG